MMAVILNSGMGSRLGVYTDNVPKGLVEISEGMSIFSRAITILSKLGINEFIITTGYLKEVLVDYTRKKFPNIHFIFINNPYFDKTNYIKSLDLIPDDIIIDDLVLLHGDLVFSESVARNIINYDEGSCVVVDSLAELPDKDFKAEINENRVKQISVNFTGHNAITCQPFYKLKKEDWTIWKNKIQEFCQKGKTNVYAEEALNALGDKIMIKPYDIKGDLCLEIDTIEDLNHIRRVLL